MTLAILQQKLLKEQKKLSTTGFNASFKASQWQQHYVRIIFVIVKIYKHSS